MIQSKGFKLLQKDKFQIPGTLLPSEWMNLYLVVSVGLPVSFQINFEDMVSEFLPILICNLIRKSTLPLGLSRLYKLDHEEPTKADMVR